MPAFFDDEVDGIKYETNPTFLRSINPFGFNFMLGQKTDFKLKVTPTTKAGKKLIKKLRLYWEFKDDEDIYILPLDWYDPKRDDYFEGFVPTRTGEIEFTLRDGSGEDDWYVTVCAASIDHPDNQLREFNFIIVAFFLTALCSLGEIAATLLAWLFPR